jgi:hypothetical protein
MTVVLLRRLEERRHLCGTGYYTIVRSLQHAVQTTYAIFIFRTHLICHVGEEVAHAGVLLALGLRGHLSALSMTDIVDYLSQVSKCCCKIRHVSNIFFKLGA